MSKPDAKVQLSIRVDPRALQMLKNFGAGSVSAGFNLLVHYGAPHVPYSPQNEGVDVLALVTHPDYTRPAAPSTPASTPQVHNHLAQAAAKTQPPTETPTLTGAAPTSPSERKDHNFAAHIKTRPTLMTEDEASKPSAPIPKWYRHKDANPAKIPAYWPDWIDAPMRLIFLYELVRVDCVKDWRTPSIFLEDVMTAQERLPEDVRDTYVLEKKEFSEPWGPDNFEWDEPLDLSSLM